MATTPGNPFSSLSFAPKAPPPPPSVNDRVAAQVKQLRQTVVSGIMNLLQSRGLAYSLFWRQRVNVQNAQGQVTRINDDPDITPDLMAQGMGNTFTPILELDVLTVEYLGKVNAILTSVGADPIPPELLAGVPDGWTLTPNEDGSGTVTKNPVVITPV